MNFREHLYSRLESLAQRPAQEFPRRLLPADCLPAALLVPLWPGPGGGVHIAFTRRTDVLPTHRGQTSFPGGRRQPDDPDLRSTALRESAEELGLDPDAVTVMGRLDDAWSSYGHHVVPWVGWLDKRPALAPDPGEVAEVIIADLEILIRPETACRHELRRDGRLYHSHAFSWEGGYVWGMTADILLELLLWINGEPSNRGEMRLQRMLEQQERQ